MRTNLGVMGYYIKNLNNFNQSKSYPADLLNNEGLEAGAHKISIYSSDKVLAVLVV